MKPTDDRLEKFVDRALRELPARRAPGGLEARVLSEIARRASLSWWRRSYDYWPVSVRVGFCVLSSAIAVVLGAALVDAARSSQSVTLPADLASGLNWLSGLRVAASALEQTARAVLGAIPPVWLYGALGVLAACYASLVGLGTAAYRTFFARS